MKSERLIPAILCGGVGSRLWSVSRDLHLKPFIRLADGQGLLQKAVLRGAAQFGVNQVLMVANVAHPKVVDDTRQRARRRLSMSL